jgi:hypothetical protein
MHFGNHHLWWLGCSLGMERLIMNQPAFPTKINTEHFSHPSTIYNTGMTLRDYFAAKAMQGQLSIRENLIALAREQIKIEDVCLDSYAVADAMLKARGE